jgi:dolichol-phosphate mannosyltransferase
LELDATRVFMGHNNNMDDTISVIIPTYNERDNIVPLVERLHSVLSGSDYEIVFVDDNSRDGTIEIATALSAKYPVRVVVRNDKRGLASAVADGINYATGKIICVMDADLQHPPEVIPHMAGAIENGADIAIASRYVKGGGCPGWGLARRVVSKAAVFLAHLLLPPTRQVNDPMSGFFMLRKKVVAKADLKPVGYKILLEILVMGQFQKITEVPYTFANRSGGESKLGTRQQVDYLKHIYSLMRRRGELVRFAKFCLVGSSGVLVNEGLLWMLRQFAGLPLTLASAISIETSIVSNFTFNNYFTFRDRRLHGAKSFLARLLKFNLVSLAGLGLNMGVLLLLTHVFGIHYLLSNLCGIAVATLWNYSVNTLFTWK